MCFFFRTACKRRVGSNFHNTFSHARDVWSGCEGAYTTVDWVAYRSARARGKNIAPTHSSDPGRAVGNPIDGPVCALTPDTFLTVCNMFRFQVIFCFWNVVYICKCLLFPRVKCERYCKERTFPFRKINYIVWSRFTSPYIFVTAFVD